MFPSKYASIALRKLIWCVHVCSCFDVPNPEPQPKKKFSKINLFKSFIFLLCFYYKDCWLLLHQCVFTLRLIFIFMPGIQGQVENTFQYPQLSRETSWPSVSSINKPLLSSLKAHAEARIDVSWKGHPISTVSGWKRWSSSIYLTCLWLPFLTFQHSCWHVTPSNACSMKQFYFKLLCFVSGHKKYQ